MFSIFYYFYRTPLAECFPVCFDGSFLDKIRRDICPELHHITVIARKFLKSWMSRDYILLLEHENLLFRLFLFYYDDFRVFLLTTTLQYFNLSLSIFVYVVHFLILKLYFQHIKNLLIIPFDLAAASLPGILYILWYF